MTDMTEGGGTRGNSKDYIDHYHIDRSPHFPQTAHAEDFFKRQRIVTLLVKPQIYSKQEFSTLKTVKNDIVHTSDWSRLDDNIFFPKWVVIDQGLAIGKCFGIVQTTPEDLLAWMYQTDSNQNKEKHIRQNGPDKSKYPDGEILRLNTHHRITYSCRKLPSPIAARDWLARGIWFRVDSDNYNFLYKSIEDDDPDLPSNFKRSTLQNVVRGELTAFYEFKRLPFGQTKFTMTARVDIKGSVPKALANRAIKGFMNTVRRAYEYFERDVEVDEMERSGETCL